MKSDISPEPVKKIAVDAAKKVEVHAPPVEEFNERDWKILVELFDRKDSEEIEEDIKTKLSWLAPEPVWEDESLDFLQEFL
ncbi:hypothetical protein Riv7116_5851 [Rivularia sp. PCC 7116]|uniref:hypothetical protein n=1 Tax=Rivularia sp. PCC 7116 TaxID=373994 RepID=UPI00029F291F|nr:hypothetical protein [Rivularia sp. PCC 7116]AFY58215.1 hypothetical protein Riv7116_5851 [Rivularia sp. PCC 7116]